MAPIEFEEEAVLSQGQSAAGHFSSMKKSPHNSFLVSHGIVKSERLAVYGIGILTLACAACSCFIAVWIAFFSPLSIPKKPAPVHQIQSINDLPASLRAKIPAERLKMLEGTKTTDTNKA